VPLVDGFDVAKHHSLFAALQVVGHWNITVGISDFGDVAVVWSKEKHRESLMTEASRQESSLLTH
jgi:hypothetical protein